MRIFNEGASEQGIQTSILFLQDAICPFHPDDMDGCKKGIATWWGPIAKKIFVEIGAQHVCNAMNCNSEDFSIKTWDCNTCISDVLNFANVMTSDFAAQDLVTDLSGPYFCQSQELALDQLEIEKCQNYVKDFLPEALQVLFSVPSEDAARGTCLYYFGLCY